MVRILPVLVLALAANALLGSGCSSARIEPPRARGGVLDLRAWDFGRGDLPLSGEWDFFPGELIHGSEAVARTAPASREVPERWRGDVAGATGGRGAGTYRLRILLPEESGDLGIRYTTVSTSFELEAVRAGGGAIVASAGKPSILPEDSRPAFLPGVAALGPASGEAYLLLRISNHEYRVGGPWRPFYLGRLEALARERRLGLIASLSLASTLVMISILFAFFIRAGAAGGGFAAFSAFALITALRSIVTGEYGIVEIFPSISFELLIRLEYLTAYSTYGLSLAFFSVLFPDESLPRTNKVLYAACAAFLSLVPLAPLRVLTASITPFYALAAATMAAIGVIEVRAAIRRRPGFVPLMAGSAVLAAAAVNDALFAGLGLDTINLFPAGMLVFVTAQAYALADRYRITQQRLREALAEKEVLFREVHHRVKNSLQVVSSIAGLEAYRAASPETIVVLENMRSRIRAISLVHERLYSLEGGSLVDAGAYLSGLAAELSASLGPGGGVSAETESVMLPVAVCVDLGLILSELVSNATKHASPSGAAAPIRVSLRVEGPSASLRVEDEGPGLPEDFDPESSPSLGMRLVSSLAKKRDAALILGRAPGAFVEIRFPMPQRQAGGAGGKNVE